MKYSEKYSTTITLFTITGVVWALLASLVGILSQTQMMIQWPSPDAVSYGVLKPLFTSILLFGAGISFFQAIGYAAVKNEHLSDLRLEGIGLAGWAIHQLGMAFGIMLLLGGGNSGRVFGEFSLVADNFIILSLILFIGASLRGLKSVLSPTLPSMFMILAAGGGIATYFLGNFSQPYSFTGSVPLFAGVQDTATQAFYQTGFVGFFIILPAFAAMYLAVPYVGKTEIQNPAMGSFQTFTMPALIPLTGSAFLAYTFAPAWIQAVGTVAVIALLVTILAGFLNIQGTIASGEASPVSKYFQLGNLLLLVWAVIRALAALPIFQKMYGFTAWNMTDISIDMQTYGLLIFVGIAIVLIQRETRKEVAGGFVSLQFLLLLAGAILLMVGDIGSGVMQAIAQSGMADDGSLVNPEWMDVRMKTAIFSVLSLLGQLSIFLGLAFSTYTVLSATGESAKPYGEAAA